jgi:hypothetical protein
MIKYEWRRALAAAESTQLADMLDRAAHYDAEPEYTTIAFEDVKQAMDQPDSPVQHLIIWMLPYATELGGSDHPERIVGVLRLVSTAPGVADAAIVIDPRMRSLGITTLLLERIGLDFSSDGGWSGTGAHTVSIWARGNHPAADRLSNRFLIPRTRRMWKLVRPISSADSLTDATVLESANATTVNALQWSTPLRDNDQLHALHEDGCLTGAVSLDLSPVESPEFGLCATVRSHAITPTTAVPTLRRLLDGAAALTHEAGFNAMTMYVDSDDALTVNACRRAGFQHDRTDVRYELGGQQ